MRTRRIWAVGGTFAALALGVTLPASADSHPDAASAQAKVRKVQVFQDASYQNRRTTFTKNRPHLKKDGWNDTISSARNKGNRSVTFYQHGNYKGARFVLKAGESEPHFGDIGLSDAASSLKFS